MRSSREDLTFCRLYLVQFRPSSPGCLLPYHLISHSAMGKEAGAAYPWLVWSVCAILLGYLVVWALGVGSQTITDEVECLLYGLLDSCLVLGVAMRMIDFGPRIPESPAETSHFTRKANSNNASGFAKGGGVGGAYGSTGSIQGV